MPKRKAEVLEADTEGHDSAATAHIKKQRVSDVSGSSTSVVSSTAAKRSHETNGDEMEKSAAATPTKRQAKQIAKELEKQAQLEAFEKAVREGRLHIYDDCNEIRRKIDHLLTEPGFKITRWLEEIGGVNNNSYQRFMKETGPDGGAGIEIYRPAYTYFEQRRIQEGKKKTVKRVRNEKEHRNGFPEVTRGGTRWVWRRD